MDLEHTLGYRRNHHDLYVDLVRVFLHPHHVAHHVHLFFSTGWIGHASRVSGFINRAGFQDQTCSIPAGFTTVRAGAVIGTVSAPNW